MSSVKCPKCGRIQSDENTECMQCGVIFKKAARPKNEPPPSLKADEILQPAKPALMALPPPKPESHLEIQILNYLAYATLIFGVAGGIICMIQAMNFAGFMVGFSVLLGSVTISMIYFIVCTVSKKIISIDSTLAFIFAAILDQKKEVPR